MQAPHLNTRPRRRGHQPLPPQRRPQDSLHQRQRTQQAPPVLRNPRRLQRQRLRPLTQRQAPHLPPRTGRRGHQPRLRQRRPQDTLHHRRRSQQAPRNPRRLRRRRLGPLTHRQAPKLKLLTLFPATVAEVANCALGNADRKTLFITAGGTLWSIPVNTPGLRKLSSVHTKKSHF